MLMHTIHRVAAFHRAFGHPIEYSASSASPEMRRLRFRLIFEELMEYGRAIGIRGLCDVPDEIFERDVKMALDAFEIDPEHVVNLPDAADALGDLDYVVQGSNLVHGFPAEDVVKEIHESNMSKLGADGRPILDEFKKVVKGPNYFKPNIAKVLVERRLVLVVNNGV